MLDPKLASARPEVALEFVYMSPLTEYNPQRTVVCMVRRHLHCFIE